MSAWEKQSFSIECQREGMSAFFPKEGKYDEKKGNVLFVSHIVDRTGAPLVLFDLMKHYQKTYNVFLVTMMDGNLRDEIVQQNIPVFIGMPVNMKHVMEKLRADEFEQIWINTLICHGFVMLFQNTNIPVFWWFHEPEPLFRLYYERMPELPLYSDNIKIVAVSRLVQKTIFKYYHIKSKLLHMPVKDFGGAEREPENNKVIFFMPARFQRTKGHDVIAKAILGMPEEYRKRTEFWFAGAKDEREPDYYELICSLSRAYPETVKVLGELSRDCVYEIYQKCDCVIAPSREDATPTTIVEGLMFECICICSDTAGIAQYLTNGETAFIVKSQDERVLQKCIEYVVDHKKELDTLRKAGRQIFLDNFEESIVWNQLRKLTTGR